MADSGNHRIQVFHPNGTLDFGFGSYGGAVMQFYRPAGVAVSPPDGRIVVADSGNHRIQVFHPNGTFDFKINSSALPDRYPALQLPSFGGGGGGGGGGVRMSADVDVDYWSPRHVAVAADGRIVASGVTAGGYDGRIHVFHPNGTLDLGFDVRVSGAVDGAFAFAVAADGRTVVANGGTSIQVFHPNGTFDFEFGEPVIAAETTGHVYPLSIAVGHVTAHPPPPPPPPLVPITPTLPPTLPPPPDPVPLVPPRVVELQQPQCLIVDGQVECVEQPQCLIVDGQVECVEGYGPPPCLIVDGQVECVEGYGPPPPLPPVVESGMIVVANGTHISAFHPNATFAFNLAADSQGYDSVAVAPDGRIVASSTNKFINVFHPDGAYDFGFGGGYDGHFVRPYGATGYGVLDVAVSPPDGRIVVAERDEHRIHVFHPNGTRDPAFGPPGAYPTVFNFPSSVAVSPPRRPHRRGRPQPHPCVPLRRDPSL